MKSIVLAALATGATARLSGSIDIDSSKIDTRTRFESWMTLFNKAYTNAEVDAKFETFKANDAFIQEYNTKGYSATVGHNEFSDMSWDAFSKVYTGVKDADKYLERAKNVNHALSSQAVKDATPASVDWSKKNAVTPIKNQGQCGSCWAFSTTGSLEGAYFLKTGTLTSFSEQNLVDCDTKVDQGCNGGLMDDAFDFIHTNKGLCMEASYPYTGTSGTCNKKCKKVAGATVKKHTDVGKTQKALMSALDKQPVSIAIEADQSGFQFYKSGVFTGACGTALDHGVLAVGYGTMGSKKTGKYWKVKNSWGELSENQERAGGVHSSSSMFLYCCCCTVY